jgi:peptide/nickel transport system substrate-binding protein
VGRLAGRGQRSALALAGAAVALLVLPFLGACQPRRDPARLIVASRNRIDTVDPAGAYTVGAMQLLSAIGDPLYAIGTDGRIEPRLATGLPRISADGLRIQVSLRRGVRFHDGTPFDAAAMVFTLERFLAIGKLSYLIGDRVVSVRATGSHSIELRLRRPFGAVSQLLSAINLTPLSPTAYRNHARRQLSDRFIGTGPYRLSFFTPQQQRLEPFAGYWGRPPANRGLDLVALSNSTALFGALPLALETGVGAELRNPLGVTIIGGLLLSQLITLYTTPVVYLALEGLRRRAKAS